MADKPVIDELRVYVAHGEEPDVYIRESPRNVVAAARDQRVERERAFARLRENAEEFVLRGYWTGTTLIPPHRIVQVDICLGD